MEIEADIALETKAGIPADAAVTHAELMRAFDEFKEANDQRLSEKRSVDVLLDGKIERLDSVIAAQTQRLEAATAQICVRLSKKRCLGARIPTADS